MYPKVKYEKVMGEYLDLDCKKQIEGSAETYIAQVTAPIVTHIVS